MRDPNEDKVRIALIKETFDGEQEDKTGDQKDIFLANNERTRERTTAAELATKGP